MRDGPCDNDTTPLMPGHAILDAGIDMPGRASNNPEIRWDGKTW